MNIQQRVVGAILAALLLLCAGHTALRLKEGLGHAWPAPLEVPKFAWLVDHLEGHDTLGLELVDVQLAAANIEPQRALYRAQQAVAPTWILRRPAAVSLVVYAHSLAQPDIRTRLSARGYEDVRFGPTPGIALASKAELTARDRTLAPPAALWRTLLALAAMTLPAVLLLRRRGRAGWLMLLALPCLLAVGSAIADLTPDPVPWTAALFATSCAAWFLLIAPLGEDQNPKPPGPRWPMLTLVIVALVAIALTCGQMPEGDWDAQAMYHTRARFIITEEAFARAFADIEGARELHPDYPPLIPFAVAGGWRLAGGVTPLVAIWVQLCFLFGMSGLFVRAARPLGGLVSIAGAALLLASPRLFDRVAAQECDLALGCLVGAGVVLLLEHRGARTARTSAVLGVLAGWALLTKNEASLIVLVASALLLLSLLRERQRTPAQRLRTLTAFADGLAPGLLLLVAFKQLAPPNDLVHGFDAGLASLERAATIATEFARLAWQPKEFKSVFAVLALPAICLAIVGLRFLVFGGERRHQPAGLVAIALFVVFAGFFLVYLTTPHDLAWHLHTSAGRLMTQLYPAVVVLGAFTASAFQQRGLPPAVRRSRCTNGG